MFHKIQFILTRSEKIKLVFIFFGSLILSLSEVVSVGIIIPITALFVAPEKMQNTSVYQWLHQLTGIQDTNVLLKTLVAAGIILFVLKSIYCIFMLYSQQYFAGKVYNRITTKLLASYLNKPYAFHLENNSAILFKNVTAEVAQFKSGVLLSILMVGTEAIIIFGILIFLIWVYPKITLILFLFFGSILVLIYTAQKKKLKLYSTQREQSHAKFFKSGMEALNGLKEIKIYNVKKVFLERFAEGTRKYTDSIVKYMVASSAPRYILETMLFTTVLLGLLISSSINMNQAEIFPMIAALSVAAMRILPSAYKIYASINSLRYYSNSTDIVYNILKNDASVGEKELIVPDTKDDGFARAFDVHEPNSIRLQDIEFQFKTGDSPLFIDFDITIPTNKTVAVVGESGAGKSTLIDILLGLLVPSKGRLYCDDVLISERNIKEYRQKIGYVPQQIFLSDDTLEANIAFGIPEDKIDVKQLKHVLKMSHLDLFVSELPQGTKTFIGEKGVKISGGQRQRIGIARALYRNPEILILDEATSSLDGHTESEISNDIISLSGNLTIIIVAHRLSTIEHADIIYVLDRGKIVDQGTFDELMENSAIFQKIANQQVSISR
jgi:ABC-type multidrug transport system fused ATPase/permease subunit